MKILNDTKTHKCSQYKISLKTHQININNGNIGTQLQRKLLGHTLTNSWPSTGYYNSMTKDGLPSSTQP